MFGCGVGVVAKAVALFCFLTPAPRKSIRTSFTSCASSNSVSNSCGGMANEAIVNTDRIDDSWASVSNKKKPRQNRTPKNHNPYVEVIDPVSNEVDGGTIHEPFLVLLVGLIGSGKSTFAQSLVASMPNKFCRINQDDLKTRQKCESKLRKVLTVSSPSKPRLCPIIDRCNFDAQQRSTWYRLAEEAVGQGAISASTTTTATTIKPLEGKGETKSGDNDDVIEDLKELTKSGDNDDVIEKLKELSVAATSATKTGIPVDVIVLDTPYDECLRRCQVRKGHKTIKSPQQAANVLKQLRRQWSPPHHDKNRSEKSRYRTLTIVRTEKERKECLLRILKQTR